MRAHWVLCAVLAACSMQEPAPRVVPTPAVAAPDVAAPAVAAPASAAAPAASPAVASATAGDPLAAALAAAQQKPVPPPPKAIAEARTFEEAFEAMKEAERQPAAAAAALNPFGR